MRGSLLSDALRATRGYAPTYDLLHIETDADVQKLPRTLCERARAPDAWMTTPSSPRDVFFIFDIIYNGHPRRAVVDTGCAEADPVLILCISSCDDDARAQETLQMAQALFYQRLVLSEGVADRENQQEQEAIFVFSAAPPPRSPEATGSCSSSSSSSTSSSHARRLELASRATLVLDLNGVLLDKLFDPRAELPRHLYHARFGAFAIMVRPGAQAFLRWAVANFSKVVVWSSLRCENVKGIFRAAFGEELYAELAAVLGNEDSPRDAENADMRDGRNCAILKDLRWLAERVDGVDPDRTVIVDDSDVKVRMDAERALVLRRAFCIRELSDPAAVNDRVMSDVIKPALFALLFATSNRTQTQTRTRTRTHTRDQPTPPSSSSAAPAVMTTEEKEEESGKKRYRAHDR